MDWRTNMAKDTLMIHNATTDEIIVRELTDDEQDELDAARAKALAAKQKTKDEAKAARDLKISAYGKLGLTAEEIEALLPPLPTDNG